MPGAPGGRDQTIGKVLTPAWRSGPLSYCPRSSLPVEVLTWLTGRLAHLLPPRQPGRGGTPPLALEVRLDAVGAVVLDGLSYRRAGRMVGISKTEVGDSMALLLGELAALGVCQPDGTFVTSLADLCDRLMEMATTGEAVCIDGLATGCNGPGRGPTRRCCMTPSARPTPPRAWWCPRSTAICCGVTAAGPVAATSTSSWRYLGSPRCSTSPGSSPWLTGAFGAWPRSAGTGMPRSGTGGPRIGSPTPSVPTTATRPACAPCGAVDRASGRRLVAAPLAWPAVPGP
jgi:hypothetical protein